MKNFKYIKSLFCLALFAFAFTGCEQDLEPDSLDFIGFEAVPKFDVQRNTADSREVVVAATQKSSSDRTFSLVVDEELTTLAAAYSVPSSVTIPANSLTGSFTINVTDDESLGFDAQTLVIGFGQESGVNFASAIDIDVSELCENAFSKLSLTFDNWAEEASWEIYDLSGMSPELTNSGGQGGAYGALDNTSLDIDLCLAPGNYGIVVYDAYGDGGTDFVLSYGGEDLVTGSVPGGNPANVATSASATFTIN